MLHRPVLLEGPDGAGKTTLGISLAHLFSAPLIRNGPPPSTTPLVDFYRSQFYPAVIDRSWPSERIYGPRLRGVDQIGPDGDSTLRQAFAAAEGTLILCLPPYETCAEAWRSRQSSELVKDEDAFKQIYAAYVSFADSVRGEPWVQYYDRTKSEPRLIKLLASLL